MDAVTSTASTVREPVNAITSDNVQELGREVFLRLLVEQLQAQDPTNPVENEDFISQLAQFTSLEQTTNINDNLESLIGQSERRTKLDLVNLIGQEVSAQGNILTLKETGDQTLSYVLDSAAQNVKLDIFNEKGRLVRSWKELGFQEEGPHQFLWDGTDDRGDRVEPGVYSFVLRANDVKQKEVLATPYMRDVVKSVMISEEKPLITLESGKTLESSDILSVQAR